jgi:hypothetical protein
MTQSAAAIRAMNTNGKLDLQRALPQRVWEIRFFGITPCLQEEAKPVQLRFSLYCLFVIVVLVRDTVKSQENARVMSYADTRSVPSVEEHAKLRRPGAV